MTIGRGSVVVDGLLLDNVVVAAGVALGHLRVGSMSISIQVTEVKLMTQNLEEIPTFLVVPSIGYQEDMV